MTGFQKTLKSKRVYFNPVINSFKLALIIVIWLLPAFIISDEIIISQPQREQQTNETNTTLNNTLDSTHRIVSSQVGSISRFIDSFFENPNYTDEEADARISLFQSAEKTNNNSIKFRTNIKGSLSLPRLSRKLKLNFTGNDLWGLDDSEMENLEESAEQSIKYPSLSLQYSFLEKNNIHIKESSGIRFRDLSLFSGLRLRIKNKLTKNWNTKFIQRLFWYTNESWISNTELNFNRIVGKRNLFRQTFKTAWYENREQTEGFRFNIISSFSQPLAGTAVLRYHWSSVYFTKPNARWSSTTFSIKYRQRLWRDWVILELAPFITWNEDINWKADIGSVLIIGLIFEEEKLTPKPKIK